MTFIPSHMSHVPNEFGKIDVRRAKLTAAFTRQTRPEKRGFEKRFSPSFHGFFDQKAGGCKLPCFPARYGTYGTALAALQTIPGSVAIDNVFEFTHALFCEPLIPSINPITFSENVFPSPAAT
jgi:hypothetical protein